MQHVLAIEAKPEFQQGLLLQEEKQLENAADVLGQLYESVVEEEGDLGDGVAPVAYLYGCVNLGLAVASNNDLLKANAKRQQEERDRAEGKVISAAAAAAAEAELPPADQEEVDDMFSIAWDSLDLARVIFERLAAGATEDKEAFQLRQANAQHKLGELKFEQGYFAESLVELENCRNLLESLQSKNDHTLALCHRTFGMAHEAIAEDTKNLAELVVAADHFAKALQLFKEEIGLPSDAQSAVNAAAKQWKLDTVSQEQIDRLTSALQEIAWPVPVEEDEEELYDLKLLIIDVSKRIDQLVFDFTVENELPPVEEEEEEEEVLITTTTTTTTTEEPPNVLQVRKRQKQ